VRPDTKCSSPIAVVTGASSGIGRAIALALGSEGYSVALIGRRPKGLEEVAARVEQGGGTAVCFPTDLVAPGGAAQAGLRILQEVGGTDVLVHGAGIFPFMPEDLGPVREHVAGAETLTRVLLPFLRAGPGQLVFVNSSVGRPGVMASGPYAESKQALRALADRLRDELNPEGIRVLSVYPGRTATPMQAAIHRQEGKPYRPERLLQPEDIAAVVLQALAVPVRAEVTDLAIRSMQKP